MEMHDAYHHCVYGGTEYTACCYCDDKPFFPVNPHCVHKQSFRMKGINGNYYQYGIAADQEHMEKCCYKCSGYNDGSCVLIMNRDTRLTLYLYQLRNFPLTKLRQVFRLAADPWEGDEDTNREAVRQIQEQLENDFYAAKAELDLATERKDKHLGSARRSYESAKKRLAALQEALQKYDCWSA